MGTSFHVFVTTCNQPEKLRCLLAEMAKQQAETNCAIECTVIDNNSLADYGHVRRTFDINAWIDFEKLKTRHGDGEHYKIWNRQLEIAKQSTADYFVFLTDRAEICTNFFMLIEKYWRLIDDPAAMLLDLLPEAKTTSTKICKLGQIELSEAISLSPFFCAKKTALKMLDWSISPCADPVKSIGKTLSAQGIKILAVCEGFVRTAVAGRVAIIVEKNEKAATETSSFVPSKEVAKPEVVVLAPAPAKPKTTDPVIFSLASMPNRVDTLKTIVEQMLPQVDRICVYLNCYHDVPGFLQNDRIEIARSQDHGDQGARGKLWFVEKHRGYHIIGDDDLSYPPDYAARMVAEIEQYQRRAVVGLHGYDLPTPFIGYVKTPKVFNFQTAVAEDRVVDIVGTGMMAFHSDLVPCGIFDRIGHPNMVDPYFATWTRQNLIPIVCIARSEKWLRQARIYPSIYDWVKKDDSVQTSLCRELLKIQRFLICIPTFNRPELLLGLLKEIEQQRFPGLHVFVADDCSTKADYSAVVEYMRQREWMTYARHPQNYGKKRFWQTINDFYAEAKIRRADYLIALQDDVRIGETFFRVLSEYWNAIADPQKAAMNLFVDDLPRTKQGHWGALPPVRRKFGKIEVDDCGWLDGEWMMPRNTLEALGYAVQPIPLSRWKKNPSLSSGDGEQISRRLRERGLKIYRPDRSLIDALPSESEMHPERTWKFEAKGFRVDEKQEKKSNDD
jgi:hypothetical protein